MTRTSHETALNEANQLAANLLSALDSGDHDSAARVAARLQSAGVQSLDRLTPRGTLEFPAGNRWEARLTGQLLDHLKSPDLPEPLTAAILNALGYWAGEEAVGGIHDLLVRHASRGDSSLAATGTIRNGLYALHLIGGAHAVQVLRDFQDPTFPPDLRAVASGYLNELGGRIVDLMFGSERLPELLSAEEVRGRDSLQDPFAWHPAAEALWAFLTSLSHSFWLNQEHELNNRYPPRAAAAIRQAFANPAPVWPDAEEWVHVLEPALPHFLVRFSPAEVMTLQPLLCFFPVKDVVAAATAHVLGSWLTVKLNPASASAKHLNQLPVFSAADGEARGTGPRRALRSWLGEVVYLAQSFSRRKQAPLVFALAVMNYRTHEELGLLRRLSFPELVQSMFRSFPSD
jgi:hypothetical protein